MLRSAYGGGADSCRCCGSGGQHGGRGRAGDATLQDYIKEEVGKMSIRELKLALVAAGVSSAGATEKADLVRLLTKTRMQAAVRANSFEASAERQAAPKGAALPPGL